MNRSESLCTVAVAAARGFAVRALLACAALGLAPAAFAADAYPSKPVHLIVNFPAGGPLDILARALAKELAVELKQPFVVENRPGAAGNIGADAVAKSAPDGYTVLVTIDTTFTINPTIYPSMPFKPDELKPLMIFSSSGLLVGVSPSVGVKTLPEFIAKAKKETMNFSTAGNGSPGHIAMAILKEATGIRAMPIPYRGNAPAVLALVSGEVQAGILATPGLLPQVRAGKVVALAVTSGQRSPLAPDVPTVSSLGLKELGFEVLYLSMVPAGTPDTVVQTLDQALEKALSAPAMKERLASLDMQAVDETGAAAVGRLDAARARYTKVIKTTGMKVN